MNGVIRLRATLVPASAVILTGFDNQYPDKVMLCRGSVSTWVNARFTAKVDGETIGMHISKDRISLTGSKFLGLENQPVCPIGSIEFAKNDELYFDTDGCQLKGKSDVRQYGTYNFITRHLEISNHLPPTGLTWAEGNYLCAETK
jgi:hypothetical protein